MWWLKILIYLIYISQNIKNSIQASENGLFSILELKEVLFANLKVDPTLQADPELTNNESKSFINAKIEKFLKLIEKSEKSPNNSKIRLKRSLNHEPELNSIDIYPNLNISTRNSKDIRLMQYNNIIALVLEENELIIYKNDENNRFDKVYNFTHNFSTNFATISTETLNITVIGEENFINIFLLISGEKYELKSIQKLPTFQPKHIQLWIQDHFIYLSVTSQDGDKTPIKIYKWLGKHFDQVQEVKLTGIKKVVPFSIHGSYYLVLVKKEKLINEDKSYSEILKFNRNSLKYESFQRLLTNRCNDIKYFTANFENKPHYFLIITHSINDDDNNNRNKELSVIYKYEDNYFIPFQSIATNVFEWQPVQDLNGDAALIGITAQGFKSFQYDGWIFVETSLSLKATIRSDIFKNVTSFHTAILNNQTILAITCDDCENSVNTFSVKFSKLDALEQEYIELLNWCTNSLHEIQNPAEDSSTDIPEFRKGDLDLKFEDLSRNSASLTKSDDILIDDFEDILKNIEISDDNTTLILNNDFLINADEFRFNAAASIQDLLNVSLINDNDLNKFLDSVLNVHDGFSIDDMEFESIKVEDNIQFVILNGEMIENFIKTNEEIVVENFTVKGPVEFQDNVNIWSSFNKVNISDINLLNPDKIEGVGFPCDRIIVNNLTIKDDLNNIVVSNNNAQISYLKHLKVNTINVGDLLNGVDLPTLLQKTIKKDGNQLMESPLTFNSLEVENLEVQGNLSEISSIDELVIINAGHFTLNNDIQFLNEVNFSNLQLSESFHNIIVRNDKSLDLLLNDHNETQYISSRKTFNNLFINNPIMRLNKIKSSKLQRYNPLRIYKKSFILNGDVQINGETNITGSVEMSDLKPLNGTKTLEAVLRNGLKLSDKNASLSLIFTQPIGADDVVADRVNMLDSQQWLQENSEETQTVEAAKKIIGHLHIIDGLVSVSVINDIDLHKLENEILTTEGDQHIFNAIEVDSVHFTKGVNLTKPVNAETLIIDGNLSARELNTTILTVDGSINSENFAHTLKNLVNDDRSDFAIVGRKYFKELHVEELTHQHDSSEFSCLLFDVINNQFTVNQSLDILNSINVNHLKVDRFINSLSTEDFKTLSNLNNEDDEIDVIFSAELMEYDKISILGDVLIEDDCINGINLTGILNDTVKIDEDHEFKNVEIGELTLMKGNLVLPGTFENLDIDTVVYQNLNSSEFLRNKIFSNLISVNGTLNISSEIFGVHLDKLCQFSEPIEEKLRTFRIEGDAIFVNCPTILSINGQNIEELKNKIWFKNRPIEILGDLILHDAVFNNSLEVQEYVDSANLTVLAENYLTKSKDQEIWSKIMFSNVTFSNISVPVIKMITGEINGIDLLEVMKTGLFNGKDQIFNTRVDFETVKVLDVAGNFTVNNLNLKSEVMRYDHPNILTESQIIKNLHVKRLKLLDNVKMDNFDLLQWMDNAVLSKGIFNISSQKIFGNVTFSKGIIFKGELNGITFNESLIKLKNNKKLHKSLLHQSGNFSLNSKFICDKNVVVKDINLLRYDQLNVSQFMDNLLMLRNFTNLKRRFADLERITDTLENSFKNQERILNFKEVDNFPNVYDIFGLICSDGKYRTIIFFHENGLDIYRTFLWNFNSDKFELSNGSFDYPKAEFMEQVTLDDQNYLYIEDFHCDDNKSHFNDEFPCGHLAKVTGSSNLKIIFEFPRNRTISLTTFSHPTQKYCIAFLRYSSFIDIFCHEKNIVRFKWIESFSIRGAYKISSLEIDDNNSVYLFVAKQGRDLKDSSVIILQSTLENVNFKKVDKISNGVNLNDLSATVIGGIPYVAFSFGLQISTVEFGCVLIYRFSKINDKFVQWQYIPITAPLGIHFLNQPGIEPLLLIPSTHLVTPLQIYKYEGLTGFKQILSGSSLPITTKLRILANGRFLATIDENSNIGTLMAATVKGSAVNV